jgi:putative transposase
MNAVAQQLHAEGRVLPWTQLCRLLDMPRSTLYYQPRPRKRSEAVDETIAAQIREIIEERPAFGVRRVHVQLTRGRGLVVNCKKVRRIMRLKHWTLRHRPVGRRPRAEKRVSIAERPDERWATDLAYVPCGRDGHAVFAPVIDSCTREVLGWELAPTGRAATAARALEDALLARFGTLHGAPAGLRLRHDNGLVFGSRQYVSLVRGYGLTQEPEAKPEIASRRLPAGRAPRGNTLLRTHRSRTASASGSCAPSRKNRSGAEIDKCAAFARRAAQAVNACGSRTSHLWRTLAPASATSSTTTTPGASIKRSTTTHQNNSTPS